VTAVAPIVYLYPALVVGIGVVAFGEPCGGRRASAVVLGVAGSALLFGSPAGASRAS
jgi:drug/metabolite transporter (DMT)-like permease